MKYSFLVYAFFFSISIGFSQELIHIQKNEEVNTPYLRGHFSQAHSELDIIVNFGDAVLYSGLLLEYKALYNLNIQDINFTVLGENIEGYDFILKIRSYFFCHLTNAELQIAEIHASKNRFGRTTSTAVVVTDNPSTPNCNMYCPEYTCDLSLDFFNFIQVLQMDIPTVNFGDGNCEEGEFLWESPAGGIDCPEPIPGDGINTKFLEKAIAYPNPFDSHISIKNVPRKEILLLEIFNTNGVLVFSRRVNTKKEDEININLDPLTTGAYFVRITINGYNFFQEKILKL